VTGRFSRAGLVRRGAAGGGMVLASGSVWAALARAASAATLPDADLSYLRLLIAAELLEADFQAQALASGKLSNRGSSLLRQMAADEKAHYKGLANLTLAAGQTPATSDDIDFSYPKGTFASATSILRQAETLGQLLLGAYLGAVENVQTPQLRRPLGQVGANEAQHAGALAALACRPVIGPAFAPSLQMGAVSGALDAYES
jgi:ferritin-like protein